MSTKCFSLISEIEGFALKRAAELGLTANITVTNDGKVAQRISVIVDDADAAKAFFERYAPVLGYDAAWFGRSYRNGRHAFKITGVDIRAPKNCMLMVRDDGKPFHGPISHVRAFLSPVVHA